VADDQKLTAGQKNILQLIRKGAKEDGWAPVSKVVAPIFTNKDIPGGAMPAELCEFEPVGEDGRGRARLTQEGNSVLDAMAWL
jgi:hypothetical protein